MGAKVRVRCPVCGMLVWQSRLNKDYDFEFVLQESTGRGYQKIEHSYKPARLADSNSAKMFQLVLALKMIEKAESLLEQIGVGVDVDLCISDNVKDELLESYEEVFGDKRESEYDVEYEPERIEYVHEFEIGKRVYEVEYPELCSDDLKRLWLGGLRKRKGQQGQEIKEMAAIGELEVEYDMGNAIYEMESEVKGDVT